MFYNGVQNDITIYSAIWEETVSETPQKKSGFFRILGLSCGVPFLGCLGLIAAGVVVVIVIAVLASAGQEAATDEAVAQNEGKGAIDNPISAGDWMAFKGGRVRAVRMMRPADDEVERMNMFNDEAAVGADYVLIWFEVECQQAKCNPNVDLDIRLIDETGKAWPEPFMLVLTDNLDSAEALTGSKIEGWQGFEFPSGKPIEAIRVEWGAATLHSEAPA